MMHLRHIPVYTDFSVAQRFFAVLRSSMTLCNGTVLPLTNEPMEPP
jgi:hypothetical protein